MTPYRQAHKVRDSRTVIRSLVDSVTPSDSASRDLIVALWAISLLLFVAGLAMWLNPVRP